MARKLPSTALEWITTRLPLKGKASMWVKLIGYVIGALLFGSWLKSSAQKAGISNANWWNSRLVLLVGLFAGSLICQFMPGLSDKHFWSLRVG